jgi:crossover junction endodeoxyribonuclease RuvC
MRVLGVDPGSRVCGFGVVEGDAGALRCLASGVISTTALERGPARLKTIHEQLLKVIDEHAPAAVSLERNFVARNVQSAFRIGEARAVAMLAAAERALPLYEYAPNEAKLAVAAFGHADKAQVKFMVRRALGLDPRDALADDAADALALAVCHLVRPRLAKLADAAGRRPRAWRRGIS